MARVGDQIKREISEIVQRELRDPGIGFVTITAVEVSPDLKHALIYYSVLGTEEQKKNSDSALKRAAGFIQQQVGRRIRLKYLPVLEFKYDQSVEYGEKIDRLLNQIHREDEKRD
jgi:ribosome-binding factor A